MTLGVSVQLARKLANCGTLFLPTDAAWASAGYNLEALSQEVDW